MNDALSPVLAWLTPKIQAELMKRLRVASAAIETTIERPQLPESFRHLIEQSFSFPTKINSPEVQAGAIDDHLVHLKLWSTHVFLVNAAITHSDYRDAPEELWAKAIPLAAAAESLGLSLDLIDDIQDDDGTIIASWGVPMTLNVALALHHLAFLALESPLISSQLQATIHSTLSGGVLKATCGQYSDLAFEQRQDVSPDEAVLMTELKSGSLVAAVYRASALVSIAEDDDRDHDRLVDLFTNLGQALGTMFQIENDWDDAMSSEHSAKKSDRARTKKTLPLVLEARWPESQSSSTPISEQGVRLIYAVYRQRAQAALHELVEQFNVSSDWLSWLVAEY